MPGVTAGWPGGLTVTASLAAALDLVGAETARRGQCQRPASAAGPGRLVLIATVDSLSYPRVRAAVDAGAAAGICGILLGDLPASASCYIGAEGTILAASQPWLSGAHATHLPADDAAAMLSLLRGAEGHLTPGPPASGSRRSDQARPGPGHERLDEPSSAERDGKAALADPPGLPAPAPPAVVEGLPGNASGVSSGDTARPPGPAGTGAGSAVVSPAASVPVAISVLGPLRITAGGCELAGGLRKARELLAYLAVHPGGATGERISADLWPELAAKYAAAQRKLALRKAREMLRTATGQPGAMFIVLAGDRYRLDPALVSVDLWQADAALDRARAAAGQDEQLAALRQATALYRGPLADGAGYEWAEDYAEPARRRAVDALARTAAILQPGRPEDALSVLETAITHDPYNEAVYQAVIATQIRLGRPDAARRTLALLETRLAGLGLAPSPATCQAAGIAGSGDGRADAGDDRGARMATPPGPGRAGQQAGGPAPRQGRHRR